MPRPPTEPVPTPESQDSDPKGPAWDPAAEHARALLQRCGLETRIPNARQPIRPAIDWARSGAMALTGSPSAPPDFAAGALASAARGAGLALRSLAPDTPLAHLDYPGLLGERAALFGLSRQGRISAGGSARLLAARDGALVLNLPRDDDWRLLPALLETGATALGEGRDWDALEAVVAARAGDALVARGRLMGLAIAPAPETIPTRPALFDCQATQQGRPRPALTGRPAPRILDLTTLWAGPLATSLLEMAGMDVLKIESPERPDGARQGPTAFFDLMNGAKRGCALDLRTRADRALFEQLLDRADIVVESARPRALAQLGYAPEAWLADRPGRIWASITGYGRSHEWIAFGDDATVAAGLAFGPEKGPLNGAGIAGAGQAGSSRRAREMRARGHEPRFCGDAIADPLTGLHVAATLLAFERLGIGGLLAFSLTDVAARSAHVASEGLVLPIDSDAEGWSLIEADRRIPVAAPRARAVQQAAPPLRRLGETDLADWLGSSC